MALLLRMMALVAVVPFASCSPADPVTILQQYLRIQTVHPTPDYASAVLFLNDLAKAAGFQFQQISPQGKPICVMTLAGSQPDLPSIMVNSHMDVVPVTGQPWTHDPFGADMDEQGRLFARGAQDMKSVGIQTYEALRRIANGNQSSSVSSSAAAAVSPLLRTVHLTFVPDEEIGGLAGMQALIQSSLFKSMNVAVELDEGEAGPEAAIKIFNGEKICWWVNISIDGQGGHGSVPFPDAAIGGVGTVLGRVLEYRAAEIAKLDTPGITVGDIVTVNPDILQGAPSYNVVPYQDFLGLDLRLPATADLAAMTDIIDGWTKGVPGASWNFSSYSNRTFVTPIDDNPWYTALTSALTAKGREFTTQIFPASTDARFLRALDPPIPCFGMSLHNGLPLRLHAADEYITEEVFLDGIGVYERIITQMANLPSFDA